MTAKLFAALAAFSIGAFAQSVVEAKVPSKTDLPKIATERQLTELEVTKMQLASTKIELAAKKFDIAGYQKEIEPFQADQMAIARGACISVGVPADKVQTECAIQLGVGADGKPLIDQTSGKPVQARVWWSKPAPPAPAPSKESK